MKRFLIIILMLCLSIGLTACVDGGEVDNALEVYCENNPTSTICSNPDAARNEIVANMFNTIILAFLDTTNEAFCEDYFAHDGLIDSCKNDRMSLVPDDVTELSDDITVTSDGNDSDFTIETFYSDETEAYTFHLSVIETEGIVKITSFTYDEEQSDQNPDTTLTDLELEELDVKFFMRDLVAMYDPDTFNCSDLLAGDALADCLIDVDNVIGPLWTINQTEVTELSTNKFLYQGHSNDGLQTTSYTITFIKDGDTLIAIDISYVNTGTYNTISKATELIEDFVTDYNDSYYTMSNACKSYFMAGAVYDQCYDTFEPLKTNSITDHNVIEVTTNNFEAELTFDDADTTVITISFVVSIGAHGYYYINGTFDEESDTTVDPEPEVITFDTTEEHLLEMFKDYHDDQTIDCDEYFSTNITFDCTTIGLFPTELASGIVPMYWGPDHYVATLFHHYDLNDEDAYNQIYPVIEVEFIIEDDVIKIDSLIVFDIPDQTDLDVSTTDFIVDMVDGTQDASVACANQGDFTPVCEANIDAIRAGTISISATTDIIQTEYGYPMYMMYVTMDGETTPYSVNLYTLDNDYYQFNGMWDETVEIDPVDPTCDQCSNQLTNEVLLQEFFEMFFIDYNNQNVSDQDFILKYSISDTATLITERMDVQASGGAILLDVTVVYDESDEYVETQVTYYVELNGVSYHDTNVVDITVESNTTFSISETTYTRTTVPTEIETTTLMEDFITDYMDPTIDNTTLAQTYFGVDDSDVVSDRFNFLVNDGTMELIEVAFEEGQYVLRYKETIGEDTTFYERVVVIDDTDTFSFGDEVILDSTPTVVDLTTAEGAITQYFFDIMAGVDNQTFCDTYYEGQQDCLPYYEFMQTYNTYELVSIIEVDSDTYPSLYEVRYYQDSNFNTILTTWTVSVRVHPDLTYQFIEVDRYEEDINFTTFNNIHVTYDELHYTVMDQYELYLDLTISNTVYCNTYLYIQDTTNASWYQQNCESNRQQYLDNDIDVDINGIVIQGYLEQDGVIGYTIGFNAIGDIGTYSINREFMNTMILVFAQDTIQAYIYASDNGAVDLDHGVVDGWVSNIVDFYTNDTLSDYFVCDYFHASDPGSFCLVDRASVAGYTYIGHRYHQVLKDNHDRNTFGINIMYQHPTTGDVKYVFLPINVWTDYYYTVEEYHYRYLVQPDIYSEEDVLTFVETYLTSYIDSNNTMQDLFDTFSYGTDHSDGELAVGRPINLSNGLTQVVLDSMSLSGYAYTIDYSQEGYYTVMYSSEDDYLMLVLEPVEDNQGRVFLFPTNVVFDSID